MGGVGVGVGEDESGQCSTYTRGGSTVAYLLGGGGSTVPHLLGGGFTVGHSSRGVPSKYIFLNWRNFETCVFVHPAATGRDLLKYGC